MKNKFIKFISFALIVGFFMGCEKDGTQLTMLDNPVPPSIKTLPDLTLVRADGANMLTFEVTPVDPGFNASAKYILEAAAAGTDFATPVEIMSKDVATDFIIAESDLNGILLKLFPPDAAASVDFRVRAILVVDAGTGANGVGDKAFEYTSDIKTADVTLYGFPRLNLINSGMDQKIESPLGDGNYSGYVKLNKDMPFTLNDPDAGKTYGKSGGALAENGDGITVDASGWYMLTVSVPDLTYSTSAYMIGLVGSATPNGWDTPDQKMDYDAAKGVWTITADLVVGEIKFRKNDGWAWNLGGDVNGLTQGGANIPISEAGNYTITLTIINDATGTCTITKN